MSLFHVTGLTRPPWFDGLQLSLDAGEIKVLRGASGSGKTLLLRTLADLDPCSAGRICLDGIERSEMTPQAWRRSVRYVHQRAPRLAESVGASLARAAEVLGFANGDEFGLLPGLDAQQRSVDLSGGEAQKLALHISLHTHARVLLLDEPTSALDSDAARRAEEEIASFAKDGGAVLWVSHEEGLAERLGAGEISL